MNVDLEHAREWLKHNKPISREEVIAELGLSMVDFEQMGRTPLASKPSRSTIKRGFDPLEEFMEKCSHQLPTAA